MRQANGRAASMINKFSLLICEGHSLYDTSRISGNMEKSIVPVICILIYMTLGVTGLMSIPWTMTAELYPIEIRGMAQGLTIALAHVIMFAALKVT